MVICEIRANSPLIKKKILKVDKSNYLKNY